MNKVLSIFNNIFCVVPLLASLMLALVYLSGGWGFISNVYSPSHFMLPSLQNVAVSVIIVLIIYIFIIISAIGVDRLNKSISRSRALIICSISLFMITVIIRLILLQFFYSDIQPFSDYERVWEMAHGKLHGNIEYYTLFPTYLNYSALIKVIIHIFGDSYLSLIYVNAFLSGILSILIFLIGIKTDLDVSTSLTCGLIYSFMPSGALFSLTGAPEFITIVLNTAGFLVFNVFYSKTGIERFIGIAVAGLMFGLSAAFKSFAVIILIALTMSVFLKEVIDRGKTENIIDSVSVSDMHRTLWKLSITCLCVMLLFFGYFISKNAVLSCTEKVYDKELDYGTATPHFLLVGLNTEGEGQIHEGTLSRKYYERYLNNGYNSDDAKEYAYSLLKSDLKNNIDTVPKLIKDKFIWAWQDDVIPAKYICKNDEAILYGLSQVYYISILLLAVIGTLFYNRRKNVNISIEEIILIIFGYFCLMLLSEAQSRYKCLIMPYICILTAIGLNEIVTLVKHWRKT